MENKSMMMLIVMLVMMSGETWASSGMTQEDFLQAVIYTNWRRIFFALHDICNLCKGVLWGKLLQAGGGLEDFDMSWQWVSDQHLKFIWSNKLPSYLELRSLFNHCIQKITVYFPTGEFEGYVHIMCVEKNQRRSCNRPFNIPPFVLINSG